MHASSPNLNKKGPKSASQIPPAPFSLVLPPNNLELPLTLKPLGAHNALVIYAYPSFHGMVKSIAAISICENITTYIVSIAV